MNSPAHILRNDLAQKRQTLRDSHHSINIFNSKTRPQLLKRCSVTLSNNYGSQQIQNSKSSILNKSPQISYQNQCKYQAKYSSGVKKYQQNVGRTSNIYHNVRSDSDNHSFIPYSSLNLSQNQLPSFINGLSEKKKSFEHNGPAHNYNWQQQKQQTRKSCIFDYEKIQKKYQKTNDAEIRYSLFSHQQPSRKQQSSTSIEIGMSKQMEADEGLIPNTQTQKPNIDKILKRCSSEQFVTKQIYQDTITKIKQKLSEISVKVDKNEQSINKIQNIQNLNTLKQQYNKQYKELKANLNQIKSHQLTQNMQTIKVSGGLQKINTQIVDLKSQITKKVQKFTIQELSIDFQSLKLDLKHIQEDFSHQLEIIKQSISQNFEKYKNDSIKKINLNLESLRSDSTKLSICTTIQSISEFQEQSIEPIKFNSIYKIDSQGFLLDEYDRYITDQHGILYQLEAVHIDKLKSYGIIPKI